MDGQVRNFRDFLQLYNKLTELCFHHCTDNFFTRELSEDESSCLDKCVLKFSNVNQRIMNAYVHDQSIINERRMKEMEEQLKAANLAATNADTALTNPSESIAALVTEPAIATTPVESPAQPAST